MALPQSDFWRRLVSAFQELKLPTSQNGIAKQLRMSQGTVQAWVRGDSLPTMDNAVRIAATAQVCVEWLLTGNGPQRARPDDPELHAVMDIWREVPPERQNAILRYARFELAQHEEITRRDRLLSPNSTHATSHAQRPSGLRIRK